MNDLQILELLYIQSTRLNICYYKSSISTKWCLVTEVNSKMRIVHLCFAICALYPVAFGYRVLGVFPIPMKSHYYVGRGLMQGLAERGHEVTVISPFKEKKPIKNYNEIFIDNSYDLFCECEFQTRIDYFIM